MSFATSETVSMRDLRNHGGDVIARVQRGETLTVTSDGKPVAQLTPLPRLAPTREQLKASFGDLPPMDYKKFRADLDSVLDPSLSPIW